MDGVMLLNRIDTKYVIHEEELSGFLQALADQYNLLLIDGKSIHPYETLYFDTPGFHLYLMHHNGKWNRYKIRSRKYVNSGTFFFEIKSKTNTNRTHKNRMMVEEFPETLSVLMEEYINQHTPGRFQQYIPALRVFFDRITLVNKQSNERLTFDLNLRYKNPDGEKKFENLVIVEVKQEKHSFSPCKALMKLNRIQNNNLSKYCLGISCLNKAIKRNRFKEKIRDLTKLGYEI